MHELDMQGRVSRQAGRGTIVRDVGERPGLLVDALRSQSRRQHELVDLREVCEPAVAHRAAVRATDADCIRMERLLISAESATTVEDACNLDERFHASLAEAAHNPLLTALINLIQSWLHPYRLQTHTTPERRVIAVRGHYEIYEAVRRKSPDDAWDAMLTHIREIANLAMDDEQSEE